jgi:hypothetical protein
LGEAAAQLQPQPPALDAEEAGHDDEDRPHGEHVEVDRPGERT